jgi:hypothetical protein
MPHFARIVAVLLVFFAAPSWAQEESDLQIKSIGPQTHDAQSLTLANVAANIEIVMGEKDSIDLFVTGPLEAVDRFEIVAANGLLIVKQNPRETPLWGFFQVILQEQTLPIVRVVMPAKHMIEFDNVTGSATIESTNGPIKIRASALDATIGDVTEASISLQGSGDIEVGKVSNFFDARVSGSGSISAVSTQAAALSIGGSGDIEVGATKGRVLARIYGSGDITTESIDGSVDVEINGSGEVNLGSGTAQPFRATINGSGDVIFDGVAVDPDIKVNGSGDIRIAD